MLFEIGLPGIVSILNYTNFSSVPLANGAFNLTYHTSNGNIIVAKCHDIEEIDIGLIRLGPDCKLLSTPSQKIGTSGANVLAGTPDADQMFGLGGNDNLSALGGNDFLDGGLGNDIMSGGPGDDTYVVNANADKALENANEGTDTIESSVTYVLPANVEKLFLVGTSAINGTGNALDNEIDGNTAKNILSGLGGADALVGGDGVDTATYAASLAGVHVSLQTGTGSGGDAEGDTFVAVENVTGSKFADTIEGDSGNNVLIGGTGIDTLSYEHAAAGVTVSLALTSAQNTIGAGTDIVSTFENLTGSGFDDLLTGGSSANFLFGLDGNDTLNGGGGADTMIGGNGNDIYTVDNSGDIVDETGTEGTDIVNSSVTFSLADPVHAKGDIENLNLTKTGSINGTGNALDNTINGNTGRNILSGAGGSDTINGNSGNDTINGGSGADILTGGLGNDQFVFTALTDSTVSTPDTITDFLHAVDKINLTAIDSDPGVALDQGFLFGGANASVVAHSVTWFENGGNTVVQADVDGDTNADFQIQLTGINKGLVGTDFLL